ncbi:hypothetical protein D3C71_1970580 [compost metagenome]
MRYKRVAAAAVAYFSSQSCGFWSGFCAIKLVALINNGPLYTIKTPEEIEMPPRAAQFAVGYSLKTNLFLFLHELHNLVVLYLLQLLGSNFAVLEF